MRFASKIFFVLLLGYIVFISILGYQSLNLQHLENPKKLLFVNTEGLAESGFTDETFDFKETKGFLRTESDVYRKEPQSSQTIESQRPLKPIYEIFQALGAYPEIDSPYVRAKYNESKFELLHENDYCLRADQYNFEHPQNMLRNNVLYSSFPMDGFAVTVAKKHNKVISNQVKQKRKYVHVPSGFNVGVTGFFVNNGVFHHNYKIGEQFLCATQMHNQIPGHYSLVSKNIVIDSVHQYMEKYNDRPQCFNKSSLFPMTYRLHEKEECQNFFEMINSQKYQDSLNDEPIQYLIKVMGKHQGSGVSMLNKKKQNLLNEQYNYGKSCGENGKIKIAQKYITNPLLLNDQHKFDFRIYMLIASTNPLIVYYHDGFLRISLAVYDKFSSDKSVHLTNTHLSNELLKSGEIEDQPNINNWWSYDQLQNYLYEKGLIDNTEWLNDYLRPAFHKALIHLTRMAKYAFWNQSNVFALHGVDFMLDDNLNLWFIESNPSPQWGGSSKSKNKIYRSVLDGHFEIMTAYYRSRMKRVLNVINKMLMEDPEMTRLEEWRDKYQKAVRNRLEPEYKISKKNNFKLIVDENLPGAQAYFGYVTEECI